METFERALCQKWVEKVRLGTRRPQDPADRSQTTGGFIVEPDQFGDTS
jgi:hypothetical protein